MLGLGVLGTQSVMRTRGNSGCNRIMDRSKSAGLICILMVVLPTVCCDVRASVKDDVLLTCLCPEVDRLPEKVVVHWRDKDHLVVLDIIDSSPFVLFQHPIYSSRVFSFPEVFCKGNFSIVVHNIQQSDDGTYDCYLPQVRFHHSVRLTVSDERRAPATRTPSGGAAVLTPTCLSLMLLLIHLL